MNRPTNLNRLVSISIALLLVVWIGQMIWISKHNGCGKWRINPDSVKITTVGYAIWADTVFTSKSIDPHR